MQRLGLDSGQAVKYAQFAYLGGWLITQDTARPAWNVHDFFGDHYARKMKFFPPTCGASYKSVNLSY